MFSSSPYILSKRSVKWVMYGVWLCFLPGVLAYTYWFGGWVFVAQACVLTLWCVLLEAICLKIRRMDVSAAFDGSAALTAIFLAISLPPGVGMFVLFIGSFFAIVLVKQLYGGLGHNFLNPAMMAYVVISVSLPEHLSAWPEPLMLQNTMYFFDWLWGNFSADAISSATPLVEARFDALTQNINIVVPTMLSRGWIWVNASFGIGGVLLLLFRLADWRIPFFVLLFFVLSLLLDLFLIRDFEWALLGVVLCSHLLSGALLLGAFFIATDPVSAASTPKGRMVYGALIGCLIYVIRSYGNYPDAVAFAVLFGNMLAPLLDHYMRPRIYGH